MSILIDSIMKKAANEGASNVLFMLWAASEIDKMATEHSHLNLPERIHEPLGIRFNGSPFFNRKTELYDPDKVKDLVNYMNDPNKPIGEPVTIINYKETI